MYEESSVNSIKYIVILLLIGGIVLALFLLPLANTTAQNKQSRGSLGAALAGNTVCSAGLGCDMSTQSGPDGISGSSPSQSSQSTGLFSLSGLLGSGSANLAGDPILTVVSIKGQNEVYRIINGLKHSIPTGEIFYSYGLTSSMIQEVTAEELAKYPTAQLFVVKNPEGEENPIIYYLTEGGMLRPILNDKVFYSYGDRKEDVIIINQKEFNYYPRNQYIFIERPEINREIYQITGGIKRYLTPVAVKRLNLKESEIAPVNQIEFDEYPDGEPVIF